MTNKIIGIQGDKLDKINISSDTSIFLAHDVLAFIKFNNYINKKTNQKDKL